MIKIAAIYALVYLLILFFSFVSEITYKKRSITSTFNDFKRISLRSFLYFTVMVVFSCIYYILGIRFHE
jgi:hypothetical protein